MAAESTARRKSSKQSRPIRVTKRKRDDVDLEQLEQAVQDLDPTAIVTRFFDLPLSEPTKTGLRGHFSTLTDIQAKAIPRALKGSDILGAAKTGSGKTLAFLVPVLENLYRKQCIGPDAGLGAMIISPTRELAIQIFDVLRKVGGRGHLFAAGLVIGGKSLAEEQHALARMNIVVCTPGRILQHLSQTATFSVDNLAILVLDEADRIMDMGFQRDVDAIVDYLPSDRQTLLFSATQTKKVSDLARLSLRDPQYVSVHEGANSATPQTLQQNYLLTPLPSKLDMLWSFIQSSKKSKLLVFLSSGKQVRFVYEAFRKMQPGIPLLHLHGRQKQTARLDVTTKFSAAKHSCLFATDVVARGLDFPAVDWVVQLDCPEDADTYIHRVGRTARYEREGRAVLFLDPSEEEGMLKRLEQRKVPIERINARAKKQSSIKNQLQGMCFQDPELKYLGQKAFASYVKSLHVQKDREIFDISKYALGDFAASLGLPGAPKIRFLKGDAEAAKRLKNAPRTIMSSDSEDAELGEDEGDNPVAKKKDKKAVRTKYDRMFERQNQDILADHYGRMIDEDDAGAPANKEQTVVAGGEDEDIFTVKRRLEPLNKADGNGTSLPFAIDSNRRVKALTSKKKTAKLMGNVGQRLVFDDDTGEARPPQTFEDERDHWKSSDDIDKAKELARQEYVQAERERLLEKDNEDRELARDKLRNKRDKKKQREKTTESGDAEDEIPASLPTMEKPFADLADLYSDDADSEGPIGREPKWFEKKGRRRSAEPETIEDLERLAQGVLQ